ncbi:MAG: 50S ribosomal protein L28 [Chitinophagales bacterium]
MARICDLTGKATVSGNRVSKSNRKIKRKFYPNLQKKRFYIPETDEWMTLKVSTKAIRAINKKGMYQYLRELEKKGDIVVI